MVGEDMERPVGGIAAHSPRHHAFVHEKEAKREEKEIARVATWN